MEVGRTSRVHFVFFIVTAVICSVGSQNNCEGERRFMNGTTTCDGMVQIYYSDVWLNVCEGTNSEVERICNAKNINFQGLTTSSDMNVTVNCANTAQCAVLPFQGSECTPVSTSCVPTACSSCITTSMRSTEQICPTSTEIVTSTVHVPNNIIRTTCLEPTTTPQYSVMCTGSPSVINKTVTVTSTQKAPVCSLMDNPITNYPLKTTIVETVTQECSLSSASIEPSPLTEQPCIPTPTQTQDSTTLSGLGAFVAVQFLVILGLITGWVCMCVRHKKAKKYTVTQDNQFHNPMYSASNHSTEPPATDQSIPGQYNIVGPTYEHLDSTIQNSEDGNHTYAVIPANRLKPSKKPSTGAMSVERRSVLDDTPAIPPRIPNRISVCETQNSRRPSADLPIQLSLPTERNPVRLSILGADPQTQSALGTEAEENIYHVLEQPADTSSNDANSETERVYHILEDNGTNQPMLGRISWSGPEGGGSGENEIQLSPCDSEEWEDRSPTTYEVPVSLLKAQDNVYHM